MTRKRGGQSEGYADRQREFSMMFSVMLPGTRFIDFNNLLRRRRSTRWICNKDVTDIDNGYLWPLFAEDALLSKNWQQARSRGNAHVLDPRRPTSYVSVHVSLVKGHQVNTMHQVQR